MKKSFAFILTLFASASLSLAAPGRCNAVAVADAPAETASPSGTYLAYDAGLIEGGDAVAGEMPPPPEIVRSALEQAAQTAGLTAADSPAVLLIYHWGVIRYDSTPKAPAFRIQPNLRSRIALIASARTLGKAEDFFRGPRPPYTEPDLRDAFELSHDARYFVIISAYDRAALARHERKLLWRVRVSAMTNSGAMNEVIPALARASGTYFGRTLSRPETLKLTRTDDAASHGAPLSSVSVQPPIDEFVRTLVQEEHDEFAGERNPDSA
jgi:hypothetical protein